MFFLCKNLGVLLFIEFNILGEGADLHDKYDLYFKIKLGNLFSCRIHMEQNLINDDLIRQLCTMYDEALSHQNAVAASKGRALYLIFP